MSGHLHSSFKYFAMVKNTALSNYVHFFPQIIQYVTSGQIPSTSSENCYIKRQMCI